MNKLNKMMLLLLSLAIVGGACAKDSVNTPTIEAGTYADGVLFQLNQADLGLQLTVASVAGATATFTRSYAAGEPIFLDINDADGGPLPDGLYKYEAWPIPALTVSRQEHAQMAVRDGVSPVRRPRVTPLTGSFSISNGLILDPGLAESDITFAQEGLK